MLEERECWKEAGAGLLPLSLSRHFSTTASRATTCGALAPILAFFDFSVALFVQVLV